ncbi:hypothetical protein [Evtepia sp.]|uniref:hypothetical protein n=1 Tax=Evtepia sp. TaxID=2773933 RepID=UPI002A821DDD|nr:hypothetical protein [Evtepia sp.]MDY4431063.1 hypothetical protein [Evtepia sp.]
MQEMNRLIRSEARRWAVPLWAVAEGLGISEATLTRRLRRELPPEEVARMLKVIEELSAEKGGKHED